jgi:hypothetical protein
MHIAIGLTMGMYLFALVMIVLNAAAFGPSFVFHQSSRIAFEGRNRRRLIKLSARRAG